MIRFDTARFHVNTGPSELFERVRQMLAGRRTLRLHAAHFLERAAERAAPREQLADFDSEAWELLTAEVRTDTAKFVNSAWRRRIDGQMWWVVIGLHDTVQTAYAGTKEGDGPDVITSGPLFDRVRAVNGELVRKHAES
jgi:hypothetical protein